MIKGKETVVVKKETEAVTPYTGESWGQESFDASDILIPKLLLMQGQSDFVGKMMANVGDIVLSTSGRVIAPRGEPTEIIPISMTKAWRIMEKETDKYEFRRNEPMTVENKNREMEWQENGTEWRADRTLNFFVLLRKDIIAEKEAMEQIAKGATPDFTCLLTPCLLQFARTSYTAGKALVTHFAMAAHFKRPPAAWWVRLSAKSQKNDLGTFFVFDIQPGGVSDSSQVIRAKEWYDIIKTSSASIKVDEGAVSDSVDSGAPDGADISNPSDKF
jgi:hypothetical protein